MKTHEHVVEVDVKPASLLGSVISVVSDEIPDELQIVLMSPGESPTDEEGFTVESGEPPKVLKTIRYRRVPDDV